MRPYALAAVGLDDGGLDPLHPLERAQADALALTAHRTAEWRAGRHAARRALAALLGGPPAGYAIPRAGDGAPLGPEPGVLVSISHGRARAVAAAARVARLGVDLCEVARGPNVARISTRFLHADEKALPADHTGWATLWAIKEAAAKALRLGLFDGGLRASRVAALDPPRLAFPELQVHVERSPEDVVAVVWAF